MLVKGICTKKHIEAGQTKNKSLEVAGKIVCGGRAFHCPMCHSISELVKDDIEVGVGYDKISFLLPGGTVTVGKKWVDVPNTDVIREHMKYFDDMFNYGFDAPQDEFEYEIDIPQEFLK